jgi:hypothetical protein
MVFLLVDQYASLLSRLSKEDYENIEASYGTEGAKVAKSINDYVDQYSRSTGYKAKISYDKSSKELVITDPSKKLYLSSFCSGDENQVSSGTSGWKVDFSRNGETITGKFRMAKTVDDMEGTWNAGQRIKYANFSGLYDTDYNNIKEAYGDSGVKLAKKINSNVFQQAQRTKSTVAVSYDEIRKEINIEDLSQNLDLNSLKSLGGCVQQGQERVGWGVVISRDGGTITGSFKPLQDRPDLDKRAKPAIGETSLVLPARDKYCTSTTHTT